MNDASPIDRFAPGGRRRWTRGLAAHEVRRVHAFTEEDGRQALVFRGPGLRVVAIPRDAIGDDMRAEIIGLLDRLRRQGADVDADAIVLLE